MFNEERKNDFLSSLNSADRDITLDMFKGSEKYEILIDKDLADFTAYQFLQFLDKDARYFSVKRLWNQAYINYTEWSIKNKFVDQEVLYKPKGKRHTAKGADEGGYVSNMENMVSGPKHLQKILDAVYPEVNTTDYSKNTVSVVRRGMYWLHFCGIPTKDVCKVTKECVDFERRIICVDGSEYHLYDDAVPVIRTLCDATGFTYEHPAYTSVLARTDTSDCILRVFRDFSEKSITTNSRAIVNDFSDKSVPYLILENVWKSGVFYRLYEEETAGTSVDLLLKDSTLLGQFGVNDSNKFARRRDIIRRYESWKDKYKRV